MKVLKHKPPLTKNLKKEKKKEKIKNEEVKKSFLSRVINKIWKRESN